MERLRDSDLDYWSRNAEAWLRHEPVAGQLLFVRKFLRSHVEQVPTDGQVLDICAGADTLGYYPADFNPERLSAVDYCPEMLEYNCAGVKEVVDITRESLPFEDSSFDLVTRI
jgi:ubiquinone/menaquinone biosynthesis C-methylase UbiE